MYLWDLTSHREEGGTREQDKETGPLSPSAGLQGSDSRRSSGRAACCKPALLIRGKQAVTFIYLKFQAWKRPAYTPKPVLPLLSNLSAKSLTVLHMRLQHSSSLSLRTHHFLAAAPAPDLGSFQGQRPKSQRAFGE